MLQFATEQLFVDPKILEVRAISAYLLPAFDAERESKQYVLLLDKDPSLHVKTRAAQTSSIEICCETDSDDSKNCTAHPLEHSLIEFDEKPAILKIPVVASTRCSLTARGLSKKSSKTLDLMVAVKDSSHFCDCQNNTCSCCNGYEGGLDAQGGEVQNMLAKDFCTPVPCAIENSNREPGPLCYCSSGYVGDIVWHGANVSGTCTPAPCYIENSTRKPGLECRCRDGFAGEVHWNGSEADGECLPATCSIEYSDGMGTDCKCMDGYAGNISWHRSQPDGKCVPAAGCEDSIENSVGEGLQCKCKNGFTGSIRWHGSVPQGSCQAAECRVLNSNMQPGLGCRCKDGYKGDIKWDEDRSSGPCTPASCRISNSNQLPGQQCACSEGYVGEITWKNQTPQGQCKPASCANIPSTAGSGTQCRCRDGFEGTVTWSGANASGECKPAACRVLNSNRKAGPACKCLEGFEGGVQWQGSKSYGSCNAMECTGPHSNMKAGPDCGCEDGFYINGPKDIIDLWQEIDEGILVEVKAFEVICLPAPCNIEHSNGKPGLDCACQDGYQGYVNWNGPVPSGTCVASTCRIVNSNRKAGLECKCSDGFSGQITWKAQWDSGTCVPAQCTVPNSNRKPGQDCKCLDGFVGEIVWKDDVPHGSCTPAPCNIRNSNLEPGPFCRCTDGFQGDITWDGPSEKGACEPVPCRVLHSDLAPGPACRCLRGFFGHIVSSGPTVFGTCSPRPLCRPGEAFHVTRLTRGLVDAGNNTCSSGQEMLVHGHAERVRNKYTKFRLKWTSADALPPGKCSIEWPEARNGVDFVNPDPEHFTLTSWCAATPGQPLCSSQIVYTVTTRNTSHYACDACKTSEHSLTEFRGSRCGYDLIKWESLTISPASPDACACNLSLSCSEIPSEELPRSCIYFAEPAVLSLDSSHKNLVFYDTGELLLTSSADNFDKADEYGATSADTDRTWLSDGKNVVTARSGNARFWLGREAGLHFVDTASHSHLRARMVLPEWWKVKFQQEAALPGSFNTDRLAGCEFVFTSGNFCYSARLGVSVWVAPARGNCRFQDTTEADSSVAYKYRSSAFGLQIYRSNVTCYPTAAFEEVQVQVVDVGMVSEDFNYTVASSPCRTTIRYMTDARAKLPECRGFFENRRRRSRRRSHRRSRRLQAA
ncbi:NOTCH1 [Symbiodinium sp. CCMP2592]|nr:NOTCH1 [Symbiodinium sp. CCMP2592]